jgi:ABC-type glutathione transport system ATPase component
MRQPATKTVRSGTIPTGRPITETASAVARTKGDTILSVRDLEVGYSTRRGQVRAVRRVSFDLKEGESLALIGESGSGKTTLGLALVRLLPRSAKVTHGEVVFATADGDTIDITELSSEELRRFRWRDCAMVFQSALNALNPVMRIRDHFKDTYRRIRQMMTLLTSATFWRVRRSVFASFSSIPSEYSNHFRTS